jgi:hypothetical protein
LGCDRVCDRYRSYVRTGRRPHGERFPILGVSIPYVWGWHGSAGKINDGRLSMGGFRYRSSPGPCYSSSNSGRRQWKKLSTRRARAATARAEVMEFSIAVNAMERAGYPRRSSLSSRPLLARRTSTLLDRFPLCPNSDQIPRCSKRRDVPMHTSSRGRP